MHEMPAAGKLSTDMSMNCDELQTYSQTSFNIIYSSKLGRHSILSVQ